MRSFALAAAFVAATASAAGGGRVAGSKHDLSVSGPGPYRAVSEKDPCIFCHVSHRAGPGRLDNRPDPRPGHIPYDSSTIGVKPGAPTGASRICLSCHDGTIAPGHTRVRNIAMTSGDTPIAKERRSDLGTDLRGTHPISFRPARGAQTHSPPPSDPVHLDASGQIQCTSCHDPHVESRDPEVGKFLVKPSGDSALCVSCHAAAGQAGMSTHATSSARFVPEDGSKPITVAHAGCGACHDSHGADVRGRLLHAGATTDDQGCLRCHAGQVARVDVARELSKAWNHASSGRDHDEGEGRPGATGHVLPETSVGARRHVACADCHDPHSASAAAASAPAVSGAIAGTWGVGLDGQRVARARFEYEICLKCHGDSANKPQRDGLSRVDRVRRAQDDVNLRRVFDPSSPSFHPVAGPGKNLLVPSLRAPLSVVSVIYCTDCHASDDGPGAGGTGARGPHGSTYPNLLERQYLTTDLTPEGPLSYALCYKCHDRDVLLSGASPFPHRKHVVEQSTPCSACHDAHGISSQVGTEQQNAHLVSFDLAIVGARQGPPRYETAGPGHGSCNLTCHGRAHDGTTGRY